jgi:hypothetical protein
MRRPPRIATWLLQRLASGPEREALAGDLIEQYQRGGSSILYNAQVLWAIVAGAVDDARQHYLLAIRAVVVWYVLAWITAELALKLYGLLGLWMWNWTVAHDWDALRVIWFGRVRWGTPPLLLMSCVNAAAIGWVIARLHRRHVAAVTLTCTTAMVVYALTAPTRLWPIVFAPAPFLANVHYAVAVCAAPISLLMGGVLGSRPVPRTLGALETSK